MPSTAAAAAAVSSADFSDIATKSSDVNISSDDVCELLHPHGQTEGQCKGNEMAGVRLGVRMRRISENLHLPLFLTKLVSRVSQLLLVLDLNCDLNCLIPASSSNGPFVWVCPPSPTRPYCRDPRSERWSGIRQGDTTQVALDIFSRPILLNLGFATCEKEPTRDRGDLITRQVMDWLVRLTRTHWKKPAPVLISCSL